MKILKVKLAHEPNRKTKDVNQWQAFIKNQLQIIRGLNPHERPLR